MTRTDITIWFALILSLISAPLVAATPKYSPVSGSTATALSADNAYFKNHENPAPDYWALSSFYVPQYNDYACSAASVSMALNALLNVGRIREDAEENIVQQELISRIKGFNWKGLLSENGVDGRHGVTLSQLAQAGKEGLAVYGNATGSVSVSAVVKTGDKSLQDFRKVLEENEGNGSDIILLHFVQDELTGAAGGPYPHVSPVGAYDAKTRRVLIFDVDRKWYEPYWADDYQVLRAMSIKTKAFGHGGYVTVGVGR